MNAIENHFLYHVRGQKVRKPRGGQNLMHFYSIHVIAGYNLSGSEIICRQINTVFKFENFPPWNMQTIFPESIILKFFCNVFPFLPFFYRKLKADQSHPWEYQHRTLIRVHKMFLSFARHFIRGTMGPSPDIVWLHTSSHSNLFTFKLVNTLYRKAYAGVPCPLTLPLSGPPFFTWKPMHIQILACSFSLFPFRFTVEYTLNT